MFLVDWMQRIRKLKKALPALASRHGGTLAACRSLVLAFWSGGYRACAQSIINGDGGIDTRIDAEDPVLGVVTRQSCRDTFRSVVGRQESTGNKGYIIHAPDYITSSAGVRCLYMLCEDLRELGYPACMTGCSMVPNSMISNTVSLAQAMALLRTDRFWVVYPEIVSGNPLGAGRVVRWVLNRPGLLGGDEVYSPKERVFCYSDVYRPYIANEIAGKLYRPTIDERIFFDDQKDERTLECYYIGKSQWKDGVFDPGDVFEITRSAPAKRELGKLFRRSKVLYNFDNSTILTYEAIICGCPVVVIPDGTQTWEDYEMSELGTDGIAWGVENLSKARANVPLLKQRYERIKNEYKVQLANFISITQQ